MALVKAKPVVWSPRGASDTLDSSSSFRGSMTSLQNLIPDPSTKDLWQCRPAAQSMVNLGGNAFSSGFSSGFGGVFGAVNFIPCFIVLGTRVYGLVNCTAIQPGHDVPFAYDTVVGTFTIVAGVTGANTPPNVSQIGAWSPPTMSLVGAKIIVTHPNFNGAGNGFFGVLDVSNPNAPTWASGNTTTNPLPAPATWVEQFGGRAYYLVNPPNGQPATFLSDVLNPTVITNANQILTFGDNLPLTCAAGLALLSQNGGIIQSLMVFKGATNIFQITGDYALNTLAVNSLNTATGTLAPNTLVSTSKGLTFVAPDGVRLIDFNARVSDPFGAWGDGITIPFISSVIPSRMCAAYNNGVLRVQTQNGFANGSPQQQWWLDFVKQNWSGPHTQAASLMQPFLSTFIITLQGGVGVLFTSDVVQSATSTFTENGVPLSFNFQPSVLPDTDEMCENSMVETTIYASLAPSQPIVVSAIDQDGNVFDAVTLLNTAAPTIWGSFTWGSALWQGVKTALFPRRLDWHIPIVFRRLALTATGICAAGVRFGRVHLKYQPLGYLQSGG